MKRTILIITGMPGVGKTTLANRISNTLWESGIDSVVLSKDKVHESLADMLGKKYNDNFRELVIDNYKRLISFCINRMDDVIILESPFDEVRWLDYFNNLQQMYGYVIDSSKDSKESTESKDINESKDKYQFITIHVKCKSYSEVYNRANNRLKDLSRHPAHYRHDYNKRLKDTYIGTMEEDMGDLKGYKELYDNEVFTKIKLGITLEYNEDNLSELLNSINDLIDVEHF